MRRDRLSARPLVRLVIAGTCAALMPAASALVDDAALLAQMKALSRRIEQLELRNAELERKLAGTAPAAVAEGAVEARIRALEDARASDERALASERLSSTEPELVTRLKAVEYQTLSMQQQARTVSALEGITIGASLTGMTQWAGRGDTASGKAQSRANYRGDVAVTLPGGEMGTMSGKIFTHLRFGQGNGIGLRPSYTSTPNTTTFEVAGVNDPDSSFAILAQAWYQLDVPLPFGGFAPASKQRLELNVGKIDPFVFFDQNAIADDETVRFTNNVFVHNPLLDSGGDLGADEYGFTPGARLSYVDERNAGWSWSASLGVFASDRGANFSGDFDEPLVIGQLETTARLFDGRTGSYRLYAWRNGRSHDFDGAAARHGGLGFSIDQKILDTVTVFARYGHELDGRTAFDDAFTVGTEIAGDSWGHAADALGLAFGWLDTGTAWRRATADTTLVGYGAQDAEKVAEIYYRYHFNNRVELTPQFQWIEQAGGDSEAGPLQIVGLRAKVGF
ncbi:MAG: carbohydrate porin [Gammaproteobacteria bacterium]|nr:carbohydrate porin [Gammaproteobacteria bacterium]